MNKLTWTGSLKKRSCLFKFIPFFYFHFSTLFCLPFLRKLHRKNALNFWWSVYYTLFYTSSPFTLMMEKTLICNCALFLTLKNICQPNSPDCRTPRWGLHRSLNRFAERKGIRQLPTGRLSSGIFAWRSGSLRSQHFLLERFITTF